MLIETCRFTLLICLHFENKMCTKKHLKKVPLSSCDLFKDSLWYNHTDHDATLQEIWVLLFQFVFPFLLLQSGCAKMTKFNMTALKCCSFSTAFLHASCCFRFLHSMQLWTKKKKKSDLYCHISLANLQDGLPLPRPSSQTSLILLPASTARAYSVLRLRISSLN